MNDDQVPGTVFELKRSFRAWQGCTPRTTLTGRYVRVPERVPVLVVGGMHGPDYIAAPDRQIPYLLVLFNDAAGDPQTGWIRADIFASLSDEGSGGA